MKAVEKFGLVTMLAALFILGVGTEKVTEVLIFFVVGMLMFLLPKPADWKGY